MPQTKTQTKASTHNFFAFDVKKMKYQKVLVRNGYENYISKKIQQALNSPN